MAIKKKKLVKKGTRQRRQDGSSERAVLRSIQALQLKCAGASYSNIATQLGVSKKQAWADVQNLLAFHLDGSKDATEKFRELENQRLDMYLSKLVPNVVNAVADKEGIVTMDETFTLALNGCLRISRIRIRLNGLAPAPKAAQDEMGKAVIPMQLKKVTNFITLVKEQSPEAYKAFITVTARNGENSVPVKPQQITRGKKK